MIKKDRLVALTQKIIQFDCENPPGNELECARFIQKDMQSLGLQVKTHEFAKNRPNIIATLKGTWPRAKAAREAILLTPHFDTVPAGKGWKFPPTSGVIKNGRIYGRGATDDKGNCAVAMEVMRSLVEDGVSFKRDIVMAATVDEETGSHQGIIPLLKKKILKPRAALILDSDDFDAIIAQKGLLHARVQVQGIKAHGAFNWRGVNAIEVAARVIHRLKGMKFKFKKHRYLRPPTVNIGTIKGGEKVNIVADHCEFTVDLRFMPGMDPKAILADIRTLIEKETKTYKLLIDDLQLPYEIDVNHPFVKAYMDATKKMRVKAILKGSEGATVITFFKKFGIPAFATGFGTHNNAHTTDEFAKISTLVKGAQVLEKFLIDFDLEND